MKLFRLQGKHDDPDAAKELVLDTSTDDGSAPEAQAPPQPEPEPTAPEEAEAETPNNPVGHPASQDNFLSAIRAEADKEVAEQDQLAAGESSQGDDALDPGLLDIFKDAKTEVEESSLAADLENIPAQEVLEEIRAIVRGLGIPSNGLERSHDDKAGQLASDAAQRQAEDGGSDAEAAEPQSEDGVVQADEEPGDGVPQERPPLTQAH